MVTETKNGRAKRTSHPIIARKIWEAIGSLQSHKKITDIDNIVTELEDKNQINATETLYQIQKCVTDRILIANKIENESKSIELHYFQLKWGASFQWLSSLYVCPMRISCKNHREDAPHFKKNSISDDEGYTFSIPPEQPNSQIEKERDWYCFECHQGICFTFLFLYSL